MKFEVGISNDSSMTEDKKLKVRLIIDIDVNGYDGSVSLTPDYKYVSITTSAGIIYLHSVKEIQALLEFLEFGFDSESKFQKLVFNVEGRDFELSLSTDNGSRIVTISSPNDPKAPHIPGDKIPAVMSIGAFDESYILDVLSNSIMRVWFEPIEYLIRGIVDAPENLINEFEEKFSSSIGPMWGWKKSGDKS